MREFNLIKARLRDKDWCVEFDTEPEFSPQTVYAAPTAPAPDSNSDGKPARAPQAKPKPAAPTGTPVSSPMTGIFYTSPGPGSPAFAKEGDTVVAGQVVGLIEAMKVFNEITAPVSGTVTKVAAQNAQLVQPGDPLVYIA